MSHCGPVHEYPHYAFAKTGVAGSTAMLIQPGMIVTNEPGYYEEDKYGIRIENIMVVEKSTNEGFLKFRPLTLVPYCGRLI